VLPEFNQSEAKFVDTENLIYEFFFYHDSSVIIYIYQGEGYEKPTIKFFKTNGELLDTIEIDIDEQEK
jgi:hypothetical protein